MVLFRSKSKKPEGRISRQDAEDYKLNTGNIHDPILTAVNEAQPFEQAANETDMRRPSYLSQESDNLKDIFGNPIGQADISNPTRARNERPLDTIRGFEYAVTGDMAYRDQLESRHLGWGFHEDFPHYNLNATQEMPDAGFERPVINLGNTQPVYQAENYSASSLKPEAKKKRGLFGRKKK